MKKLLRLFSAVLAFAVMNTSVYAMTSDDEIQKALNGTKIVSDYGDAVFNRESSVTRAQMCNILAQVLNITTHGERSYSYFKDVPDDYWALREINAMYEMKIINGTSDGYFSPEDTLSTVQCYKMLVNILNYSRAAESWGGYPVGYIYVASKLGLSDGVEIKDAVTGADVARIIYNALDVDAKSSDGYGEDGIYYDYGDYEKNKILDSHNIVKESGRIIKNEDTAISWGASPSRDGYVNIDGTEYKCGDTDISDYLGYNVDFYYNDETDTVLCFIPSEGSKSIVIDSRDIVSSDSSSITYSENGSSKDKKITLSSGANIIYNGKTAAKSKSIFDIDDGRIIVIDSGSNSGYDTVFVNEYKFFVAYGATERDVIYLSSDTYDGNPYINLSDIEFSVKKDGTEISAQDIETDSVIALRVSADKKLFLIDVYDSSFAGSADSLSKEDEITVDGKTYELSPNLKIKDGASLERGKSGIFYTDINGRIFYIDFGSGSGGTYAYVESKKKEEFKDVFSLQLFTENEKEEEFDLASSVKMYDDFGDGAYTYKSMKAEKAYDYISPKIDAGPLLIKYTANNDGKINAIYLPSAGKADGFSDGRYSLDVVIDESTYYAYGRFVNRAHTGSKTRIFVISNDENGKCDDRYSYVSKGGYFNSGSNYGSSTDPIYFYDVSETGIAGAVLVIEKKTSVNGTLGSGESFSTFVVTSTGVGTDSDGDEKKTVTVSFGGSESTVNFADNARPTKSSLVQNEDDLKFGDVIIYRTNNRSEISDWQVMLRGDSFKEGLLEALGGGYYNAYATAYTVMSGYASSINSDAIKISANGNSYTFTNSGIKFVKVDMKRKTVCNATMSDCICVDSDVSSVNSKVVVTANRNAANYVIIFE
mgnify:CR=1 FL=1